MPTLDIKVFIIQPYVILSLVQDVCFYLLKATITI